MDIYLSDKGLAGERVEIKFAELPEKIKFGSGTKFREYDILDRGPVKIPFGRELETVSWEGRFSGKARKKLGWMSEDDWIKPRTLNGIIRYWMKRNQRLYLKITGSPIRGYYSIEDYSFELEGGFGDINYSITLVRYRTLRVGVVRKKGKGGDKGGTKRAPKDGGSVKKHTVKEGENLWVLAQKYYKDGSKSKKIYDANKDVIEKAAKKKGKKSSQNGYWVFKGTVLKIP